MIIPMSLFRRLRLILTGNLGKFVIWFCAKSSRIKVIGEGNYRELREKGRPVVFLIWHGRIFIAPYFFRKRGIMPLISPSEDGEIAAQISSRWGFKNIRGSGSHAIIKAWNQMKNELKRGGEVIIVTDGPKGPNRKMKVGGIKLAQETGGVLVPFTFSSTRKKFLKSWDKFLIFYPFSRVVAIYGSPIEVDPELKGDELEKERQRIERVLIELDRKADRFFE